MLQWFSVNLLNGVSVGLLLFMLSAGLTLIFSMLGVLNFTHASFYMLGAYTGQVLAACIYWPALIAAPTIVGIAGTCFERLLLRRVYSRSTLAELLLTFGAAILIGEGVKLIWGLGPVPTQISAMLDGPLFTLYGTEFPRYRPRS